MNTIAVPIQPCAYLSAMKKHTTMLSAIHTQENIVGVQPYVGKWISA